MGRNEGGGGRGVVSPVTGHRIFAAFPPGTDLTSRETRPRSLGPPLSPHVLTTLRAFDHTMRDMDGREHMVVVDPTSGRILDRSVGDKTSVDPNVGVDLTDKVIIHNHPDRTYVRFATKQTAVGGSGPSNVDVLATAANNGRAVVATSRDGAGRPVAYVISRPARGWPIDLSKLENTIERAYRHADTVLRRAVAAHVLTPAAYHFTFQTLMWNHVSRATGIGFRVIPLPKIDYHDGT